MAKIKRERTKPCSRCEEISKVLYRVRVEADGDWIFVCSTCLKIVKPSNPHYQYGGTWKSKKRH